MRGSKSHSFQARVAEMLSSSSGAASRIACKASDNACRTWPRAKAGGTGNKATRMRRSASKSTGSRLERAERARLSDREIRSPGGTKGKSKGGSVAWTASPGSGEGELARGACSGGGASGQSRPAGAASPTAWEGELSQGARSGCGASGRPRPAGAAGPTAGGATAAAGSGRRLKAGGTGGG